MKKNAPRLLDGYTGYKEYYDDILHIEASKKFNNALSICLDYLKKNVNDDLLTKILSYSGSVSLKQFELLNKYPTKRLSITQSTQQDLELTCSNIVAEFHKQLLAIPEIKAILKWLMKDEFINYNLFKLFNRLDSKNAVKFSRGSYRNRREEIEKLFFSFLSYYLFLSLDFKYNKKFYIESYLLIEYYIVTKYGKEIIYQVPLTEFSMPADYFRLGNGFVIRKIKFNERLNNEYVFEIMKNENFIIEFSSEIGSVEDITGFPTGYEDLKLDFLKGFLQVFKAGRFRFRAIFTKIPRLEDLGIGISTCSGAIYPNYFMPPRYPPYGLRKNEMRNFRKFGRKYIKLYQVNKNLDTIFDIAVKRFLKAVEEFDLEDKIIDLIISLECLFGDDQEISFKIALRVSNFLGTNPKEKLTLFNFVKEAYRLRNSLVHGSADYRKGIKINGKPFKLKDVYYYLESITRLTIQQYIVIATSNTSRDKMKETITRNLLLNLKSFSRKQFFYISNKDTKTLVSLYRRSGIH